MFFDSNSFLRQIWQPSPPKLPPTRKQLKTRMLVSSVALAALSIPIYIIGSGMIRNMTGPQQQLIVWDHKPQFDYEVSDTLNVIDVHLDPKVDAPEQITAGDSFLMKLKVRPLHLAELDSDDQKVWDAFDAEVKQKGIEVRLNLAGADVKPKTPQRTDPTNTSAWSVMPQSGGGKCEGVFAWSLPADVNKPTRTPTSLFEYSGPYSADVKFRVEPKPPPAINWWALVPAILGALISASALIKFGWEWIDRMRKEKEKKKIIITP